MSQLALFLLGAPRIECDGEPTKLKTRKALALIAYLTITGKTHTRDALATLLWPKLNQTHARATLRQTLLETNKALDKEWFDAGRDSLAKCKNSIWLDVDHFYSKLAEYQAHGRRANETCLP